MRNITPYILQPQTKGMQVKTTSIIITAIVISAIAAMGTAVPSFAMDISDVIPIYSQKGAEKILGAEPNSELAIVPVDGSNVLAVYEQDHELKVFVLQGLVFQEDQEIFNYFPDKDQ